MDKILDIYTDYLIANFGQASATGLSNLLDSAVSHDQITRFLNQEIQTGKDLWQVVKPLVKEHQHDDGILVFDDTIIEKMYSDRSDLNAYHWDHSKNRSVKGINLLSAFYIGQQHARAAPVRIPVTFELIIKDCHVCDIKTQKEKHVSRVTKNELMRQMITQMIANGLKFKYIVADSWYASVENMAFINKKKKQFIFDLKSNRHVCLKKVEGEKTEWIGIDDLDLPDNTPTQVWLKGLDFPVLVVKQRFTNQDESVGIRFLVSNDFSLSTDDFQCLYQKRWGVEEYHKSLKQNTGIGKSPAHGMVAQRNHLFASLVAYVKLEKLKFTTKLNHFAIKTKIYVEAAKIAFKKVQDYKIKLGTA